MSVQERQKRFMDAMTAAEKAYGIAVMPVVETEKLGEALLMKPKLKFVQIAGWVEPEEEGVAE